MKLKKIVALVLALAFVLSFAACTKGGNNGGKKTGDVTVVIGDSTQANGDWAYGAFASSINATDQSVINLTDDCVTVQSNENGDYVINDSVVDKFERTEDDDGNATYTFKIKEGLQFNNGDPIKAENFLAWLLFITSPAGLEMGVTKMTYAMIPGGDAYSKGEAPVLAGARLLGDYEFAVTVLAEGSDGNAYLPYYYDMSYAAFQAVNLNYWFGEGWSVADDGEGAYMKNANGTEFTKDAIEKTVAAAQFATSDRVTAGPYNLVKFDKTANEITLEMNDKYCGDFQGQKPSIKKLVIVKAEDETVIDTISTGGIQIYSGIADGDQVNALLDLIDSKKLDSSYCKYDRAGYGYFGFACDIGPTQYTEFRQAVAMLLDRGEFANTFCQGWGSVVHGPYCTAFSMYEDSKDFLAKNLNTYDYNPEGAVKLLKEAGFIYNEDGSDYEDGSGKVRYKRVTADEAKYYEDFCKTVNGEIYMPAIVNWASSEGNSVSDLLSTMLANGKATKEAGIEIKQNVMTFDQLLNYLYRQDISALGDGDYAVPKYNMFNLATGWSSGAYDFSFEFTTNQDYIDMGYNVTHLYDEKLDKLSMDMVYGVESGDYDTYLDMWQQFVLRYNELLPQVPLYANIYMTVYPNSIANYQEGPFWGYARAILYATPAK